MKNPDRTVTKAELKTTLSEAFQSGDNAKISEAMLSFGELIQDDLAKEHPLLSHITFVNVGANTKWVNKNGKKKAAIWNGLVSEIQEILYEGLSTLDIGLFKLSGFIPVHNAMLDLDPEWLDRYVRTGLENGIVAGNDLKMPAGGIA